MPPRLVIMLAAAAAAAAASAPARPAVAAVTLAFRIVGAGHPISAAIDEPPCPEGRWSAALYPLHGSRRIGTQYGCGLSISKGVVGSRDPAWIRQTAREHFVLPGGAVDAVCRERFTFTGDLHHSRARFRCRVVGGGTITGGGAAVDGRANYVLRLRRTR